MPKYESLKLINLSKKHNKDFQLTAMQEDCIDSMLKMKEYVVTMSPGRGKTLTALVACKEVLDFGNRDRVLVVCPKGLVEEGWKENIHDEDLDGYVDVVHYQVFNSLFHYPLKWEWEFPTINKQSKYLKLLTNKYKVIIFDEIHKAKNESAQIGNNIRQFNKMTNIEYKWALTGTIAPNTINDTLTTLGNVTNHPIQYIPSEDIDYMMNLPEVNGVSGRQAIYNLVKHSLYTKSGVDFPSDKMPKLNIQFVPIRQTDSYKFNLQRVKGRAKTFTAKGKFGIEREYSSSSVPERTLAVELKMPWIKKYLSEHDNVFVVGTYLDKCLIPLSKEFNIPIVEGKVKNANRKMIVDKFGKGDYKHLLGQSSCVGTGVDGIQCYTNTVLITNFEWDSAFWIQLISRLYRVGTIFNEVNVIIPFVTTEINFESLEVIMLNHTLSKQKSITGFLGTSDDNIIFDVIKKEWDKTQKCYY
jgi:superfamily II DNA or RNA helicase